MPATVRARRLNLRQDGYAPLRPIEGRPPQLTRARRFVARLSDQDGPASNTLNASDFLQAALTFAETCAGQDGDNLRIAVTDAETGETRCFTLGLT